MQLHQLKPIHKKKKPKTRGRGGKKGTYSGRGMKGQKSRAGRKLQPLVREWIKRYPKLRGYKFKGFQEKRAIVNVKDIARLFKTGEIVNPEILLKKKMISKTKGKIPKVKILGKGKLAEKLVIENCEFSESVKKAIEKAGGVVKSNIKYQKSK